MGDKKEKMIDRFDLVRAYQKADSKEDFLYMLLNLEAVQAQSGMVAYIREILQCMRQYARQRTLAVVKGIVSSIFPGRKEDSGNAYERWEDTPEFDAQMEGLWRALGIDYEAYSGRDVLLKQEELSKTLAEQGYGREALCRMDYDPGLRVFSVPDIKKDTDENEIQGRSHSFAVLSRSEYDRLLTYIEKEVVQEDADNFGQTGQEQEVRFFDTKLLSGDIIVNAEPDVIRRFLAELDPLDREEARGADGEPEVKEAPDEAEQEKQAIVKFAEWLDRIQASQERCVASGFSKTAAATALFLHEHGLEKRDGRWVQVITSEDGTIQEKPLSADLIKGIDRDREAQLLNTAYRTEALEKAEMESREERELQRDMDHPARNKRIERDR